MGLQTVVRVTVAVAVALFCLISRAHAQTAETDDAEAHQRFEAGRLAFAAGRYADALDDFRHAYGLSHRAQLLYNIGQCADRLRHDAEALDAFETYLREAGDDAAHRTETAARVEVLREAVRRAVVAPPPDATEADEPADTQPALVTPSPAPQASARDDTGSWIGLGVSAAVLVAGAVMLGIAESDRSAVENAGLDTHWSAISDQASRGPVLEGVGIACLAVGALGAGILAIVLATPSTEPAPALSLRIGLGSLSLAGAWR